MYIGIPEVAPITLMSRKKRNELYMAQVKSSQPVVNN